MLQTNSPLTGVHLLTTDVSILQRTPNMEVLSLSVNGISSLRHFMLCKGLKELYLRKNMIEDINDIR